MSKSGRLTPYDIAFGQRLRAARLANNLSQERLGEHLNVTFQQVQKYEKGVNAMTPKMLLQAAKVLDVPPLQLLGDDEDTLQPRKAGAVMRDFFMLKSAHRLAAVFVRMRSDLQDTTAELVETIGKML